MRRVHCPACGGVGTVDSAETSRRIEVALDVAERRRKVPTVKSVHPETDFPVPLPAGGRFAIYVSTSCRGSLGAEVRVETILETSDELSKATTLALEHRRRIGPGSDLVIVREVPT